MALLSSTLPSPSRKSRQIFVAYPYKIFDKKDYRKVFKEAEAAFSVTFVFADEKITDLHILQKIFTYIRESKFSIFDISGWNPNVTLELGLALGLSERTYIIFNPDKTQMDDVPSDIRGVDRLQFRSFADLGEALARLLEQEFPIQQTHQVESQLDQLREKVLSLIQDSDGLKIGDIAGILGVNVDVAKIVVKPLVPEKLIVKGQTKGAKYFGAGWMKEQN